MRKKNYLKLLLISLMLGGNFFSATLVLGKELDSQSLDQRQESVVENSSGSSKEVSTVNQSEANRKTESSSHEMDTSVVRSSQLQGQPRIRKQTSMNSNEAIDIKLTDSFFPMIILEKQLQIS